MYVFRKRRQKHKQFVWFFDRAAPERRHRAPESTDGDTSDAQRGLPEHRRAAQSPREVPESPRALERAPQNACGLGKRAGSPGELPEGELQFATPEGFEVTGLTFVNVCAHVVDASVCPNIGARLTRAPWAPNIFQIYVLHGVHLW